jgi:extradiol dioxygenase family protein
MQKTQKSENASGVSFTHTTPMEGQGTSNLYAFVMKIYSIAVTLFQLGREKSDVMGNRGKQIQSQPFINFIGNFGSDKFYFISDYVHGKIEFKDAERLSGLIVNVHLLFSPFFNPITFF